MAEENTRLARELDSARARLAEAEGTNAEMVALREERDLIRTASTRCCSRSNRLNL